MTDQDLTMQFERRSGATPELHVANDTQSASDAVIREALSVIDQALGQIMSRELMSSGEVADVLLDVRMLLTTKPVEQVN